LALNGILKTKQQPQNKQNMKRIIIITAMTVCGAFTTKGQQFISKGNIEFEVKQNMKKLWSGNDVWSEMLLENISTFKTAYFKFSFADGKSLYKLDRFDEGAKLPDFLKRDDEENEWYTDYNKGELNMKKSVFGTPFFIKDSLQKIQWRFSNENRVIAGFNCRKAIGKIYDSVYVFAFYTDEITITGGPCGINGLPGMIMGVTIPRLYTSWIVTKLSLEGVDESNIKPQTAKKTSTVKEYRGLLLDRSKDWGGGDDEEGKKWVNQFLWSAML
jgi:GLPGLI family protein